MARRLGDVIQYKISQICVISSSSTNVTCFLQGDVIKYKMAQICVFTYSSTNVTCFLQGDVIKYKMSQIIHKYVWHK